MSACSLWSGIIYLYPAEEGIIPCWGWCASAALQMMVAAIHVTPMHGAMQDGAVQGQESNSVILEGPFQLSLFWDSPSAASGTFLWRLNQHSSACLPLSLPSCPGQRVQIPSQSSSLAGCGGKSALCSHSNVSAGKGRIQLQASSRSQDYILVSEMKWWLYVLDPVWWERRHISKDSNYLDKALYARE